MVEVRMIEPEMTYSIRHKILRPNQTIDECKFETDYHDNSFHLGGFYDGNLVSIVSFCLENHGDFSIKNQYRLRAMATLNEYQKLGAGRSIVNYGENIIKERGSSFIWCNARTTAQDYYIKLGFKVYGEVFDYSTIGPHIIMYKDLSIGK